VTSRIVSAACAPACSIEDHLREVLVAGHDHDLDAALGALASERRDDVVGLVAGLAQEGEPMVSTSLWIHSICTRSSSASTAAAPCKREFQLAKRRRSGESNTTAPRSGIRPENIFRNIVAKPKIAFVGSPAFVAGSRASRRTRGR
jgi:hypothetical protein